MTDKKETHNHFHDSQWRIDAREHLVLALVDFAQAAATLRRRLFVSHCDKCDNDGIARMLAAGRGYVVCD